MACVAALVFWGRLVGAGDSRGCSCGSCDWRSVPSPVAFWMIALPSGAVIGILQGLVLRRLGYRAGLWVAASMASWYVGLTLGIAVAYNMGFMLLMGPGGWVRQHA